MNKLFVLLFSLILSSHGSANEYHIAFPIQNFYPHYQVDGKTKKGLLVEVIQKFSNDEKLKIKIDSYPVSRYLEMFQNGEVDFVFPDNPKWQKAAGTGKVTYSQTVMKSKVVFFSHSSLEQNQVKTIATIKGYVVDHFQKKLDKKEITITPIHNVDSLLQFVQKKRSDVGYFHQDIIERRKKGELGTLTILQDFPHTVFSYHLSTVKHPEIIETFNKWLENNKPWIQRRKSELLAQTELDSLFDLAWK